ncbi:glycosyltransferase involved in cell wall biosynthesis [Dysgonomonadaceae bacterium PH5-43]|nr:glycosyltransferase involved in cell wall biosynthesis [Dysgonomonadaceae bacterium PH5-43]
MNKILSIVIAAYNMEQLLPRCLDSLLKNPNEEVEIIVINDGSKDNTLDVAISYQSKYSHIVRVIDKPNGGWGTAINRGIIEAQGKYLKTLDSDDWFDSIALDDFIKLIKKIDADLIATSFTQIFEDKQNKKYVYDNAICNREMLLSDYFKMNNYSKFLPIQALCIKTKILQNNKFKLSDRYYTDIEYNLIPLTYVDTIYFSKINLYQYYLSREGQSVSLQGYKKNWLDYVRMCEKLVLFYEENKTTISEDTLKMYIQDTKNVVRFSYELLLSPRYSTPDDNRKQEAILFDSFLREMSQYFYTYSSTLKVRKLFPYVKIWRNTGLNILKLF